MKFNTIVLFVAASLCSAIIFAGCGGGAANTANNAKPTNNTAASNTTKAANTATESNAANAETAKKETAPAGDSVGVPECDEYIKKYEACLTKIAAKNPQIEGTMKTAFEAQRNGFKTAASTPQGKATLASACKQAVDTAKASTAAYACEW